GPVLSETPVMSPASQLSVAVGAAGRVAEHWSVTSGKLASLATGGVVSCTCTAWVWLLWLALLSVEVQVIVSSPWPNGPVLSETPVMSPASQLSVAFGAAGRVAEHWSVTSGKLASFATGGVVSSTCAPWVWLLSFTQLVLRVQVIIST